MPINEGLPQRTKMTLDQIDGEFARVRAGASREESLRERPGKSRSLPADADSTAVAAWLEKHPKSFWGLRRLGARLVVEGKWAQAKDVLEKLKATLSGIRRAG